MSTYTEASFIMLPCGGNKEGKLYSVKPTSGDGDFTVVTGEATYTEDGIIKTAPANFPRIQDGAVKVENFQSTQLVLYSEDFSTWTETHASTNGNSAVSPDETQNASIFLGNTDNTDHYIRIFTSVTGDASFSIFAKAKELRYLQIVSIVGSNQNVNFDVLNGSIGTIGSDFSNIKIETLSNGWFRCSGTSTIGFGVYYLALVPAINSNRLESWSIPNTDGLYIWGAQVEEGLDASSYIKSEGSQVTRIADQITTTPPVGTTEIIETINGIEQPPITVIPAIHELTGEVLGVEEVENGDFNNGTVGWSEPRNRSTLSNVNNKLRSTSDDTGTFGAVTELTGLTIGNTYNFSLFVNKGTANAAPTFVINISVNPNLGAAILQVPVTSTDTYNSSFIATATIMFIGVIIAGHSGGEYFELDNVSTKEVISRGGLVNKVIMR
jgi:hypothetical protein